MASPPGDGAPAAGGYGTTEATPPPGQEAMTVAPPSAPPPPDPPRPLDEAPAAQKFFGEWAFSTFGCCFDPLYSCFFCWCYPVALVLRVASIVEKVGKMNVPIIGSVDRSNALVLGIAAVALSWLGGIPYLFFVFVIYKGVQARFAIREGDVSACCHVVFCPCCTWIKLGRHVDAYSEALGEP
uniref:Uncharacterized protein n=1 Tax=Zooxanthella nutricula TaxID=1333877 RepID=A0A6U8X510_9DINO|mmetsp:Transcript_9254/g.27747  ORF Transcript_9254/g.27747 Transcript_9254/m.27747 type:complete len:183 (+) Transcript_9254:75-623(+)